MNGYLQMSKTPAWVSTDGVPHFGVWNEEVQKKHPCGCGKSTHKLLKQFDSMIDPELQPYIKANDAKNDN